MGGTYGIINTANEAKPPIGFDNDVFIVPVCSGAFTAPHLWYNNFVINYGCLLLRYRCLV